MVLLLLNALFVIFIHSILCIMPRKAESSSPTKLKQKTLIGFLGSSPAASSSGFSMQTFKRAQSKAQKRGRVVSPESDSGPGNNTAESDGSDVGAVHFEPEVIDLSDEDESPRRPRTKRRTPRVRAESSSPDEKSVATSGGSLRYGTRRKSKNIGKRKHVEDDSGSEDAGRPKMRKFVKGVRPSSPEEDDNDLLDEVDEHRELLSCNSFDLKCKPGA